MLYDTGSNSPKQAIDFLDIRGEKKHLKKLPVTISNRGTLKNQNKI